MDVVMEAELRPAIERANKMGYVPMAGSTNQFPPIAASHVYDDKGKAVPGYQRLFREDSGDTLAIHSESYALRPYESSFALLEAAIAESALDTAGLMVKTEFSHNGGRCFRSYLFPKIGISVGDQDPLSLQILAFDSYDGTYSTSIAAGAFRYICLNGCFFGRTIQQLKIRHVGNSEARFDNGMAKVIEAAATFTTMQPRLQRWAETSLDIETFHDTLKSLPQVTQPLTDHLVSRYAIEAEETTLYGAWNVLTNWATRGKGNAQSRVDRDRRVAALIESKAWLRLEGVA